MLKELMFWNKWSAPTKIIYWVCIALFVLSLTFLGIYHFLGLSALMDWTVSYEIKSLEVTIDHLRHKIFDLPIRSENFVVFQYFEPSEYQTSTLASSIFVGILGLAVSLGLSIITTYRKMIWFGIGSFFFVFWLTYLNLDLLGVFGQFNNTLLAVMLVSYLGLAFLYYAYLEHIHFYKRVLSFIALTAVFGFIIFQFSSVPNPIVHLASFGCIGVGLIFIVFLCITGYEVLQLALSVMTSSTNDKPWTTPLNLFVVTALYLGNIIIYYMYIMGDLSWEIPYNVYLFFPICALLGIWSHRKRSVLYDAIIPFAPGGAMLYMTLAIVSFATLGYLSAINLTPALKVFEVIFIVIQGAFGIAFFAYSVANFYKPMMANMPVNKMFYAPRLMPHYVLRGLGLFLALFFVGKHSDTFLGELKSSYYTLKGNWYLNSKDYRVAEENYKFALLTYSGGHQASYGLATIYLKEAKIEKALQTLSDVKKTENSEYLYISLSNIFKQANQGVNQMLFLKEGLKNYPESYQIANNLGLTYYNMGYTDSAMFYIQKSIELKSSNEANANYIGIAALENLSDGKDLELDTKFVTDEAYMTNAYALSAIANVKISHEFDFSKLDEDGSGLMISLVNNYVDKHINDVPKELVNKIDEWYAKWNAESNGTYLAFLQAKTQFYNGNTQASLKKFQNLIKRAGSYQMPFYTGFTGLMYTKLGLYNQAYDMLLEADQANQMNPSHFIREATAVMAMETNDKAYAKLLYPYLATHTPAKREQYEVISEVLGGEVSKTAYHRALDLLFFNEAKKDYKTILAEIPNGKLKEVVIISLLEKAIDKEDRYLVKELWKIVPEQLSDESLLRKSNLLNMRTLQLFGNATELKKIVQTAELEPFEKRWATYFEALIAQEEKDTATASKKFSECINRFPKNEQVLISYITYLKRIGKNKQAYELCSDYLIINTHTKPMLLLFADLAFKNGLFFFAEETVRELRTYMDPKEYETYQKDFQKALDDEFEKGI